MSDGATGSAPHHGARHTGVVEGAKLFSFGLMADSHVRLPGEDRTTPFQSNNHATSRTREAVRQIAELDVDFVIHLGDVVHPVPHMSAFAPTADLANDILSGLGRPVYIVPGNHDIGDKRAAITPAHPIDEDCLQIYTDSFARDYQSFDRGDIHVVIVNSSLFGSGLAAEAAQLDWLENDLAAAAGQRIFLATHYPFFLTEPDEPSYYDNVEPDARRRLLDLLGRHRVEAVFAGHVHNFFYNMLHDTEFYVLLSTSFVRQDYAELLVGTPGPEWGRDDIDKLGWARVDVYERGHVVHVSRSLRPLTGATDDPFAIHRPHPKLAARTGVGIDLREPWAEKRSMTYNGPVDEFTRRRARNDYTLLALWEMGVRDLRMPLADVLEPDYRDRIDSLVRAGHRITMFTVGVPDAATRDLITGAIDLIDALELILPWSSVEQWEAAAVEMTTWFDKPVYLAPVISPSETHGGAVSFGYVVSHGFDLAHALDQISAFHDRAGKAAGFGYTLRIAPDTDPLTAQSVIATLAHAGIATAVNVSLAGATAGTHPQDDDQIAARVVEATILGLCHPDARVFLDTLTDHDRGYFPRNGLYDGRANPRPAAGAIARLNAVFGFIAGDIALVDIATDRQTCILRHERGTYRVSLRDGSLIEQGG